MSADLFLKVFMTLQYLDPALRVALKQFPADNPASEVIGNALDLVESTANYFTHPRGAASGMIPDPSEQKRILERAFSPEVVANLPALPWTEDTLLQHARAKMGQ